MRASIDACPDDQRSLPMIEHRLVELLETANREAPR
jgi:hypothetical protein